MAAHSVSRTGVLSGVCPFGQGGSRVISFYRVTNMASLGDLVEISFPTSPTYKQLGFKNDGVRFKHPDYYQMIWTNDQFSVWQPVAPTNFVVCFVVC